MSGSSVLTLLLYLWIGITVAMVLMWLFRRRSGPPTTLGALPGEETSAGDEDSAEADTDLRQRTGSDSSPDSIGKVVLGETAQEPPSTEEVGETGTVAEADSDDGDEHGVGGDHRAPDKDRDDRHLVSTALGVGLTPTREPSSGQSVAELLADIELPYDLQPMDPTGSGRRAVYLSPHSNPEDVGTEFADQLVRLGYSIEPRGLDQAVARRGRNVLHMRIVPEAGAVVADDGETRPFDRASPTDTALELWIGGETDVAIRW